MARPRIEDTCPNLRFDVLATYKRLGNVKKTGAEWGLDHTAVLRILREVGEVAPANPRSAQGPVIVWRRGRHGIKYPVSVYDPDADTTSPLRMNRKAS